MHTIEQLKKHFLHMRSPYVFLLGVLFGMMTMGGLTALIISINQ